MDAKRITIFVCCIVLLVLAPLGAADVSTIIEQAKRNSSRIQLIELQKANSDISIAMGEVEETTGITVSGEVSYKDAVLVSNSSNSVEISPSIVITLPNDGNTKITVGASSITKTITSDSYWSANPSIGMSHTFKFGDNGDALTDLKLAQQKLSIDYQYRESLYNFESSIYSKIAEILAYEMDLLDAEKNLLVQQTQISNALKLKTTTEGSTTYRNMQLNLAKLENAKTSILRKMAMAKTQYEQLTGLVYEDIGEIGAADLEFSYLPTGDTNVIIAAMELEIASEELALQQRRTVSTSTGKTTPSLVVDGSASIRHIDDILTQTNYKIQGGIDYYAGSFSTSAAASLEWLPNGTRVPSLTIGGSWSNNPTVASDVMEIQTLQNDITIAGINYQEAMLTYQSDAGQLEADILSHQLDVEAFKEEASYRQQLLEDAIEAFERGLVTQTDVDQARLDVELTTYQNRIYALQALILENRAKALQL
ncbi:hypothetical protein [Pleomorphochaeta sp. DL1XJH-081]|uniref:hypothetical protein n=1 Tax=Pleomorphochaeta sp. DL1XJH-081 TaxID=3409690 RepID=UPI003BB5574A